MQGDIYQSKLPIFQTAISLADLKSYLPLSVRSHIGVVYVTVPLGVRLNLRNLLHVPVWAPADCTRLWGLVTGINQKLMCYFIVLLIGFQCNTCIRRFLPKSTTALFKSFSLNLRPGTDLQSFAFTQKHRHWSWTLNNPIRRHAATISEWGLQLPLEVVENRLLQLKRSRQREHQALALQSRRLRQALDACACYMAAWPLLCPCENLLFIARPSHFSYWITLKYQSFNLHNTWGTTFLTWDLALELRSRSGYNPMQGHFCWCINYHSQFNELRGCVNDAKHVRNFLIKHGEY